MITRLRVGLLLMVFSVLNVYGQEEQGKVISIHDKDTTLIMKYRSIGKEVDSIFYFKKNGEVVRPIWDWDKSILKKGFTFRDLFLLWTKRFLLAIDADEFNYTYYVCLLFENFEVSEVRFMLAGGHDSRYDSVIEDVLKSTIDVWQLPVDNDHQPILVSLPFYCSIGQLISRGIHPPDDYYEDFEKHDENTGKHDEGLLQQRCFRRSRHGQVEKTQPKVTE